VNTSPLLERHIACCIAQARGWADPVVRATSATLSRPASAALQSLPREAIGLALERVQARGPALSDAFVHDLGRQLQAELAPRRTPASAPGAPGELSLVDEEQAAEEVELVRTIQLIESGAETELRELQALTATVRGQAAVSARSNPLRPEILARSFWAAATAVGMDGHARRVLLRAAGEPLTVAMQQACRDAIGWLTEWGVQPAAWKVSSVASGRLPGPPTSGFDVTRPGALDELRSVASGPGARARGAGPAGRVSPEALRLTQQLLAALDQLPRLGADVTTGLWLRRQQRQWAVPTRDTLQGDAINLLTELFERMLGDMRSNTAVLERISRLQPTFLRLALTDASLFASHGHPAWRMVNQVASHTLGYDDAADPRLLAFFEQLEPWIDGVAGERSPSHGGLRERAAALDALCLEHLRQEQMALGGSVARLRRAEREATLADTARDRIRTDLGSPHATAALSPALRAFFVGPWCDAIGRLVEREGDGSATVQRMASLPRALVASLQPTPTRALRAELLKQLPSLAGTFQTGLALTPLTKEQGQTLADELLARHSEVLAATARAAPASAEDIVRQMREAEPEPLDHQARLAPNTIIDETHLDTLPAPMADNAAAGSPRRWVETAQPGLWCHMFIDGGWRPARLVWLTDTRQHWLFAGEAGQPHLLTASAVMRLAREGLLQSLEERNLLERAVDGWLADSRGIRTQVDGKAAATGRPL
jgi:hypothetical protein